MEVYILVLLCALTPQAQVTVNLSPDGDFYAVLNTLVQFNCTVTDASNPAVQWLVNGTVAGDREIVARGVTTTALTETSDGVLQSVLNIPASLESSNTSIVCRVFDDSGIVTSPPGFLFAQGLLNPPPNVTLTEGVSQLARLLTWGAPDTLDLTDIDPDIQVYQVCYNLSDDLTCINVSSSERREFRFPNVCVPLVFTVTAFNVVGEGRASSIVHNGSTSGCDEGISVSTLQHQVSFMRGKYPTVTLSFNQVRKNG